MLFTGDEELPVNLLSRAIESEALPACAQQRLGVWSLFPLAQGLLSADFAEFVDLPPICGCARVTSAATVRERSMAAAGSRRKPWRD